MDEEDEDEDEDEDELLSDELMEKLWAHPECDELLQGLLECTNTFAVPEESNSGTSSSEATDGGSEDDECVSRHAESRVIRSKVIPTGHQ